jgi:hypothetical protein
VRVRGFWATRGRGGGAELRREGCKGDRRRRKTKSGSFVLGAAEDDLFYSLPFLLFRRCFGCLGLQSLCEPPGVCLGDVRGGLGHEEEEVDLFFCFGGRGEEREERKVQEVEFFLSSSSSFFSCI